MREPTLPKMSRLTDLALQARLSLDRVPSLVAAASRVNPFGLKPAKIAATMPKKEADKIISEMILKRGAALAEAILAGQTLNGAFVTFCLHESWASWLTDHCKGLTVRMAKKYRSLANDASQPGVDEDALFVRLAAMMPPDPERLSTLARTVRSLAQTIVRGKVQSVQAAIECGRIIRQAKRLAGHGGFIPWLEQCSLNRMTANRYLRLAQRAPGMPGVATLRQAYVAAGVV